MLKPSQITKQNNVNLDDFKGLLNELVCLPEEKQGEICQTKYMEYEFLMWIRLTYEIPKNIKLFLVNDCKSNYKNYDKSLLDYNYNDFVLNNFINIFEISKVISLFYESSNTQPNYFDVKKDTYNCGNDACIYSSLFDREYVTIDEFHRVRDLMTKGCLVIDNNNHDFSFPYSEYKNHVCPDIDIINDVLLNSFSKVKQCNYCDSDTFCISKIKNVFKYNINDNKSFYYITPSQVMMAFMVCGFKYKLDKCKKHKRVDLKFEAKLRRPSIKELDYYIKTFKKTKSCITIDDSFINNL